jgi:tetratricopeptide (TPR) repeat protein
MIRSIICVLLVMFVGLGSVHAEDASAAEVAQQFVNLGQTLFKEGNYKGALENLVKAAERLAGTPQGVPVGLYRNIARCHDQLGAVQPAIENFQRFVEAAKGHKSPKMAKAVRHAREAIKRLQRLLDATAVVFNVDPASAVVAFDGKRLAAIPKGAWRVSPGKHTVLVSASGYGQRKVDFEVAVGATVPLMIRLEPGDGVRAAADASAPKKRGGRTVPLLWGVLAATAVSGAIWAALESDALYRGRENDDNLLTAESEKVGTIGFGLAAVGAGAVIGMIITWPDDAGQAALVPTLSDTSAGFVWRMGF